MMTSMRDNIFGARVGQVIEQRELTQGQVELKTGLGQGHISQIISGKRRPRIDIAIALARALGVSLDWLAGLPPPPGVASLDPAQRELVEAFGRLTPAHQTAVLRMVRDLVEKK